MNGARVLVVDDEPEITRALRTILTGHGYQPTVAATAAEGLDLLDRRHPDVVLLDLMLPDGTGLDVMRHVRGRQKIRGIALSGFGQDDDLRRSREAGFEQHLTKPVNLQTLRDVILHPAAR